MPTNSLNKAYEHIHFPKFLDFKMLAYFYK
jgi:hypothetical protein